MPASSASSERCLCSRKGIKQQDTFCVLPCRKAANRSADRGHKGRAADWISISRFRIVGLPQMGIAGVSARQRISQISSAIPLYNEHPTEILRLNKIWLPGE